MQYGTHITKQTLLIRRRKNSDKFPSIEKFIPFFYDLMCPAYQIYIIFFQKVIQNLFAKQVTNPPITIGPVVSQSGRVTPEQVVGNGVVFGVQRPLDVFDLRVVSHLRRQSAMHAQDRPVHDCGEREPVEHVVESFPKFEVVPAFAFILESLFLIYAADFMVAS